MSEVMTPTVIEITSRGGNVTPIVARSIDEAIHLQALLGSHLGLDTDIVFAGVDPHNLYVSENQKALAAGILKELDAALAREQERTALLVATAAACDKGENVVSLCAYRTIREASVPSPTALTFDIT